MRYFEITGGMRLPVSEEERDILSMVSGGKTVDHDELTERDKEVARLMVSRGLLNRRTTDDKVKYSSNNLDVWRN